MTHLTKSNEDYLEAILILENSGDKVKSVRIANMLGVSKPGVNKAMNILKDNGFIEKTDYSDITLTEKGREIANEVYKKHLLIKDFLIKLGVSEDTADIDCCKIEHVISEETFSKIEEYINKKH